jgi:pyrroline-5-carboxylate reductase
MATSGDMKVAILGMGHMGSAIAEGLLAGGMRPSSLALSSAHPQKLKLFRKRGVRIAPSNEDAAHGADIIIVAVKPAVVLGVLQEIRSVLGGKLVVSAAAGVTLATLKKTLGPGSRVARIMPNIPVAVGEGVIALYAPGFGKKERAKLEKIFETLGTLVEVSRENSLDTYTLLSGCGPGFVSLFIAALAGEGGRRGMKKADAERVARATFKGTAVYLEKTGYAPMALASSVATKGGVTEAILARLLKEDFPKRFARAIADGEARLAKRKKS